MDFIDIPTLNAPEIIDRKKKDIDIDKLNIETGEHIKFDTDKEASWFAKNYKRPGMIKITNILNQANKVNK